MPLLKSANSQAQPHIREKSSGATASRSNWIPYALIAPAAIYLAVFSLYPIVLAGWMSLHDWRLLRDDHAFVGMANYTTLAGDPFFFQAMWNTLVFVALGVPASVVAALAAALLVAQALPGVGLFRTIYYIPAVCSQVAISMVWTWILMPTRGLLNLIWRGGGQIVESLLIAVGAIGVNGLSGETRAAWGLAGDIAFLESPSLAMLALVAMFAWLGLGPRMLIFVAGVQNIPTTLYEAAAMDGAGPWRRFRSVTLPLLAPTTLFVAVTTTIAAFQIFTPIYMLTRGGPERATDVVMFHIYAEAWQKLNLGMASAMSYVLLGLIVAVSLLQMRLIRRDEAAA